MSAEVTDLLGSVATKEEEVTRSTWIPCDGPRSVFVVTVIVSSASLSSSTNTSRLPCWKQSCLILDKLCCMVITYYMRDDSVEILFQSLLHEALVSSSGMGRDVQPLMLSIQHFLCRPPQFPLSKVPWRMVLETLFWHVTCPNHANFHLLAAKRQICLRFLILTQPPLPGSCFVLLLTGQTLDCVSLVPQIWSSKFCFCHHKVVGKMNKHKKLITCHAQCA